ncbi:MAG: amino acid ABC transporter substrate-binding protein [Burkholderiales bacterium]
MSTPAPTLLQSTFMSLIIGLSFGLGTAWAGPVLDRIKQTNTITIGHRESSVPLSYFDANQKPVGYAVELCVKLTEAVRKHLQLRTLNVKYQIVTPADRIMMVEQGKVDMECGSTTNNAERRKKVAFTVPHYVGGARYAVRADSKIAEITDFEGKKLVSTERTTPLSVAKRANQDRLLGITILEVPDHARAIEMVEKGEADGFVMDDVLLYGLISARPDPAKLKVVGKFLTVEPLAIMLSKDDPELKKIFNDEMKRMIYSGEAAETYERWFMKPVPPKGLALGLPMSYLLKDFWKYPTDQVPF